MKKIFSSLLLCSLLSGVAFAQTDIVEDAPVDALVGGQAEPLSLSSLNDEQIKKLPENTLIPVEDDQLEKSITKETQGEVSPVAPNTGITIPEQSLQQTPKPAKDELSEEEKEKYLNQLFSEESIKDIKSSPEELAEEEVVYPWMWIGVSALLLLLVLGLVIYIIIRRRNRPVYVPSIFEVTMERLHTAELLMEPSKVKEFSLAVSEAVRAYLEGYFGVHSTTSTTEEFLDYYLNRPDSELACYRDLLKEFLEHCDLAKFAGAALTKTEMNDMMACARQLVTETYKEDEND